MAFMKTSIAFQKPRFAQAEAPTKGEKRDGLVWDGEQWIPEKDWEEKTAEVNDG